MVLKSVKDAGTNKKELEIEVGAVEFEKGINAIYKNVAKKYPVFGFRKGKAPRGLIERKYGKSVFYEDAMNYLCPKALDEAIKESNLDVLLGDKMNFDLKKVDENGFCFTVVLTIRPEISIDGYKGIKLKPFEKKLTPELVETKIESILKNHSKLVPVEGRACKEGDTVYVDFVGKINDKPFSGGTATNYEIKLGSHDTIEGFESGIEGHSAGETFDIPVTFPEGYAGKKIRGKDAVFTVSLKEIKENELPKLTDDLVKEISKKENVEEFKKYVEEMVKKELEDEKEEDLNMQIIDAIVALVNTEIPQVMYDERAAENLRLLREDYLAKRITLQEALDYTKVSPETNKNKCQELAEQQIKLALALEAIARQENLFPSDEEIEEEYKKLAENSKSSVEKIKENIPVKIMKHDKSCMKAFEFLKDSAIRAE